MMKIGKGTTPFMAPHPMKVIGAARPSQQPNKGTAGRKSVAKPKLRMAGSMRGK